MARCYFTACATPNDRPLLARAGWLKALPAFVACPAEEGDVTDYGKGHWVLCVSHFWLILASFGGQLAGAIVCRELADKLAQPRPLTADPPSNLAAGGFGFSRN